MPFAASSAGVFGFGRVPQFTSTGLFQVDLASFSNWHTTNSSNYIQYITNFYRYVFDGGTNNITDGGNDMWDGGNFVSLSGFVTSANINYGTLSNTPLSKYGFFLSQANVWPQIGFAYVGNGTITWSNSGDVGSDGAGLFSNFSGTYTTTNQERNGQYWVNENYNATDPTICYVWFTILQPSYNSIVTACNDNRKQNVNNTYTQSFGVTGSNLFFSQILLSRSTGVFIPTTDIQSFLSNYVQNAQITFL